MDAAPGAAEGGSMNKVIRIIGALVLAILTVSVPVIFGISIAVNWNISPLLGIVTVVEIVGVCIWYYFAAEDEQA